MSTGLIREIIGAVIDVEFTSESIPAIYNALVVEETGLVLEVQQHIGDGVVRTVAMGSSDGLKRKMSVKDTLSPIQVPVGEKTLGRILNVLGDPIDFKGSVEAPKRSIHQKAPAYKDLSSSSSILETGIDRKSVV